MRMSCRRDIWMRGSAISATALVVFALGASSALARDISQSGEQKNMRRVGHSDLQGRAAYHPDFIRYPDGRVIAFVGTHSNTTDNGPRPNPLQAGQPGGAERNDDRRHHQSRARRSTNSTFPARSQAAQPRRNPTAYAWAPTCQAAPLVSVYMMRNVQVGDLDFSGYEVWDVTNVTNPTLVGELRNLRNTHKHWWECKTGIAYLPGSQGAPAPQWRQGQSMMIVDWKNPANADLPAHSRAPGQPTEWIGTGAPFAAWSDLRVRPSQ